jgi:uncharacterized protein YjbI with pentapeptide repeats
METVGGRWGDAISDERRQTLDHCVQEWEQLTNATQSERQSAFDARGSDNNVGWTGGRLSGADVFYLAVRTLAIETGSMESAATWLRGDFSQVRSKVERFLSALHLEGADLSGAQLKQAILLDAHLESANLSGANLEEALLDGAHLEGASLADANLYYTDFVGAYLLNADFSRAHMENANLDNAYLARAIFIDTHLDDAIFSGAHLDGVDLSHVAPPTPKQGIWWWQRWRRSSS